MPSHTLDSFRLILRIVSLGYTMNRFYSEFDHDLAAASVGVKKCATEMVAPRSILEEEKVYGS